MELRKLPNGNFSLEGQVTREYTPTFPYDTPGTVIESYRQTLAAHTHGTFAFFRNNQPSTAEARGYMNQLLRHVQSDIYCPSLLHLLTECLAPSQPEVALTLTPRDLFSLAALREQMRTLGIPCDENRDVLEGLFHYHALTERLQQHGATLSTAYPQR